jgi:hypothetical protein
MELIISIALLGTIMAAVMTLFMIGIRNYQRENQRNIMQKEINFTTDDIGTQIKQAAESPGSYDSYIRGPQNLILALPAVNEKEDFLYSGEVLLYDYYIYYLQDGYLYKKIIPNDASARSARENALLGNVTAFNCDYQPMSETEIIQCTVSTSKKVSDTTLNFNASKTARLRNHR